VLITFKSEGSADVMMFGDVAMKLMELIGKEPAAKGVVTVEQLPQAIERLRQAIEADKAARRGQAPAQDDDEDEGEAEGRKRDPIGIARRGLPLLELLEHGLREEEPVVWGV
jgi:hypothetical protein